MTDQELKDLVAGLAVSQANTEARQAEAEARQAEAEARQAEAEARQAEAEARQAKNDAQIAKTDAIVRKISRQYGNHINNQSRRAEEFFIRGIKKMGLQVAGFKFDDITPNLNRQGHSSGIELDGLLTNGEVVAILEVKTRLHVNDVDAVYHKRIPAFRQFFREYRDKSLLVLVGGLSINSDALAKAHEYGFICLRPDNQQLAVDASSCKRFIAANSAS